VLEHCGLKEKIVLIVKSVEDHCGRKINFILGRFRVRQVVFASVTKTSLLIRLL
jgi:hypothetical protein